MDLIKFGMDLNVEFADVKTALKLVVENFSGLQVNGPTDAEGYAKARDVIKDAGVIRRNIEAKRKTLKEDSVEIGRLIDGYARDLQSAINPLEDRLKGQVKTVDDFIEMEKAKKKRLAELPVRKNALSIIEHALTDDEILVMDELQFANKVAEFSRVKIEAQEAETRKLREEAAERDRVAAEAARVEAAREEERQKAAQDLINREALRESQAAEERQRQMEQQIWPVREMKIRNILVYGGLDNIDQRMVSIKSLVLKMDEVAFEKYLAEAQESADAKVAQRKAEMGDRELVAEWLKALQAVPVPKISTNSIYQGSVDTMVMVLKAAAVDFKC